MKYEGFEIIIYTTWGTYEFYPCIVIKISHVHLLRLPSEEDSEHGYIKFKPIAPLYVPYFSPSFTLLAPSDGATSFETSNCNFS